ncbi:hypothetical protein GDO78_020705 [Eleutherodactylus coqui]|uniref:Nuclear receptor subfamily 1 group I member 3 n=1 Tax=Eleutherodactylus coqui TaxID=57060 RepID=A0A8J6B9V2_ELECQ|nr:hypothetical protein GDO78_020705 [Eleutherodactylus coqui]
MNNQDLAPSIFQADWSPVMFPPCEEDSNSSCGSLGASALNVKTSESDYNDPDAEEKLCAVCGDKANGYHFHVLTCEGCKGFFRRSMTKGLTFTCPFTRSCPVTKAKRRRCQACRLQKCLEVGMRKDMILSEEALTARRQLRMKKRQERLQRGQKVVEVGSLTEEQQQLITTLIDAHRKHFDANLEHFVGYRPQPIARTNWENFRQQHESLSFPDCSLGGVDQSAASEKIIEADTGTELPHFADLSTYMIQQVINFAKEIPVFRALSIDDQISLLKGATMEISHLQYNTAFNLETKIWECGRHKLTIEHGVMNRPGVIEHKHIDKIQETIAMTLKCYIDYHHPLPGSRFLFAKLLSMLAELRTLNEENTKQMVHIQNVMEDAMTPLMKEIFS